ncbi:hypothetical protein BMAA1387 [Burkholderia mallei ATCC 23344]|uniref:Uncharacterized protein n=1 Tax=Burkholderia mallei (strain ATCC 23344) TaxID=243160 RepID=A0A0H2WDB6_BURMA|nr:hypothetical protein BMAA1387 [Burkholderia mallei ATCC 23344]
MPPSARRFSRATRLDHPHGATRPGRHGAVDQGRRPQSIQPASGTHRAYRRRRRMRRANPAHSGYESWTLSFASLKIVRSVRGWISRRAASDDRMKSSTFACLSSTRQFSRSGVWAAFMRSASCSISTASSRAMSSSICCFSPHTAGCGCSSSFARKAWNCASDWFGSVSMSCSVLQMSERTR